MKSFKIIFIFETSGLIGRTCGFRWKNQQFEFGSTVNKWTSWSSSCSWHLKDRIMFHWIAILPFIIDVEQSNLDSTKGWRWLKLNGHLHQSGGSRMIANDLSSQNQGHGPWRRGERSSYQKWTVFRVKMEGPKETHIIHSVKLNGRKCPGRSFSLLNSPYSFLKTVKFRRQVPFWGKLRHSAETLSWDVLA